MPPGRKLSDGILVGSYLVGGTEVERNLKEWCRDRKQSDWLVSCYEAIIWDGIKVGSRLVEWHLSRKPSNVLVLR